MANKNEVEKALDHLAEAAKNLACHGAGGYDTASSAMDVVLVRALRQLNTALVDSLEAEHYDPENLIYECLPE